MRQIRTTWVNPDEYNSVDSETRLFGDVPQVVRPSLFLASIRKLIKDGSGVYPFGPLEEILSDDGKPMIESVFLDGFKNTVKTPDFRKRCDEGEIIMNDYHARRIRISWDPARQKRTDSDPVKGRWVDFPFHVTDTYFPRFFKSTTWYDPSRGMQRWWSSPNCITINGVVTAHADGVYPQFVSYSATRTIGVPIDPRFDAPKASSDLSSLLTYEVDHPTVQKVLAKANAGDLDVLTELAEMPTLVRSIIDGFKLILKIFKDAKKKQMTIFATVPSVEKRIATEAHKRFVLKKLKNIPTFNRWKKWPDNRGRGLEEYRIWRAAREGQIQSYETFLANSRGKYRSRALREVSKAMSDVTLNTFYNIQPAIYTIQDACKAMDHWEDEYRRWGNGNTPTVTKLTPTLSSIPEAKFVGTAETKFRCLIKRRYFAKDLMTSINSGLGADILVTGFELWRLWSIVFDWFFTLSDALRALPWNTQYSEQKSCLSWTTVIDGHFTWEHDNTTYRVDVFMEDFRRSLYNPANSIGIYFKDTFGVKEALASLAFAVQALDGPIRRRYA